MGRKSAVDRAPAPLKKRIEQFLRDNRMTLDEMVAAIKSEFGAEAVPSRSSLHRYRENFQELTGRMREIEAASAAMVGELGEGVGEKAGALLAQAVTTLATHAALSAQSRDDVTIDEVRKLARAAKDAIDTRRISLVERQALEKETRERLVREQKAKLATLDRKPGIDADTLRRIREEVYGITS